MAGQPRKRAKNRQSYQHKLLARAKADQAAELTIMGYGTDEVAAALGTSKAVAQKHLTHALKEAATRLERTRSELLAEKLLQLRTVRYHAYQQFLASTDPIRKRTKTYRRPDPPAPVAEGDEWKEQDPGVVKAGTRMVLDSLVEYTEGRLGNNGYLQTILSTVQEECDILGLYAPKDLNVNAAAVVQLDWAKLLQPPQATEGEPDKIQDAFAKLEGLPDATPLLPEQPPTLHTNDQHNGTNGHVNGYTGDSNGHHNGNGNGKH